MNKLKRKVTEATAMLLSILFIGSLVLFTIGLFVCLTTEYSFVDCITGSVGFWIASTIGWFFSACYLSDTFDTNNQ